jgi:HEPN domain-containing protein
MMGRGLRFFTAEDLDRPLFEDTSPACEREDPFSGPQGFMLGGMSQTTIASLSEEYFDAANLIVEAIKRGDWEDYKVGNAALFLYRHSVELLLKAALGKFAFTHSLSDLADSYAAMILERYGQPLDDWIVRRLGELASMDPRSTMFRYGAPMSEEIYVSLPHLQSAMLALNAALSVEVWEVLKGREVDHRFGSRR